MNATAHTFEIPALTATRLLNAAGLTGVTVNLPTNLLALQRLVNRTVEGTAAMQITANLNESAADLFEWYRDMGLDIQPLRVPDAMNTAAAATAAANVLHVAPVGTRKRGQFIGWAKVQLDRLMVHADTRHPAASGWASEGFWQLVRFEPDRTRKLLGSLEAGRLDDVLEALIDYVAARKRAAGRAVLDTPDQPVDQQLEAMKDEQAADAEHHGY